MKILKSLLGSLVLLLLFINLVIFALLILLGAVFVYIIPNQRWRHVGTYYLLKLPVLWVDLNKLILQINAHGKIVMQNQAKLNPKGWYIVVSNHQTWVDILIVNYVFNRKLPVFKFFMKRELLWTLPFAGLACYVLGFPFMRRHSRTEIRKNPELKNIDIETTKRACEKFKEHPTAVINFAEGTRFSNEKRDAQNSPFQNLLKPRAAGTAIVVNELKDKLDGVVDVTIIYDKPQLSIWDFACGNFQKIEVTYQVLKLTDELYGNYYEDRNYRADFQRWFNQIWTEKDRKIAKAVEAKNES